jgi:hypothetical protein
MNWYRTAHGAVSAGLVLAALFALPAEASATTGVPYTDPSAVGYIGLCDQSGQQVTSGTITSAPFAWQVVSSAPARAPYNNAGRTATLYAFLPLEGFPPGDWSGETLTAASAYSNPTAPMAVATSRDPSLNDFIEAYPPKWNGLIQLRLYLDTTGQPAATKHYPALNIRVTGARWEAVGGGPVNCGAGSATSAEVALGSADTSVPTSSPGTGGQGSGSSTTGATTGGAGAPGSKPGATTPPTPTKRASGALGTSSTGGASGGTHPAVAGSGSGDGPLVGALLGVLAVLTFAAVLVWRRLRRRHEPGVALDSPNDDQYDNF